MQQPLPVGFLVDADKEDGADLEREEAEAVYVASEGGVVGVLDALRVAPSTGSPASSCTPLQEQADSYFKRPLN